MQSKPAPFWALLAILVTQLAGCNTLAHDEPTPAGRSVPVHPVPHPIAPAATKSRTQDLVEKITVQDAAIRAGALQTLLARYERELTTDPRDATSHYLLGRVHGILGHSQTARRAFEQALLIDPAFGWPHHGLGVLELRSGHRETALLRFEQARTSNPDDFRLLLTIANTLFESARKRKDADLFQRCEAFLIETRTRRPRDPEILLSLAIVHAWTDRLSSAINLCWQVIALAPMNPDARFQLGLFQEQSGQLMAARTTYHQALGLDLSPDQKNKITSHLRRIERTSTHSQPATSPAAAAQQPHLTSTDRTRRRKAWKELILTAHLDQVSMLLTGLQDEDYVIRLYSVRALGTAGARSASNRLVEVLSTDPEEKVRACAARTLADLKILSCVFHLVDRLRQEESAYVCEQIDEALSRITGDHPHPGGRTAIRSLTRTPSGRNELHDMWQRWLGSSPKRIAPDPVQPGVESPR